MNISEIMTKNVTACSENDTLAECANNMAVLDSGAMPVIDENGVPVGMITDRDITIRAVARGVDVCTATVDEFETPDLIAATPDMSLEEAADMMSENQIRRLPVMENGSLVGIVTLGDLVLADGEEQLAGHALHEVSRH